MGKILDKLAEEGVLVSDGAWGTFLHKKGLRADECPESWNLERPDDVLEIAQSYVDAGSDLILTNSFGGSPFKLDGYGMRDMTFELNRAAAEISKTAAGDRALVLGSVGPTGKMIFMGEVPEEELMAGMEEQVRGLVAGGIDGVVVETMSDLEEAKVAIAAAKSASGLDVACTFTFSRTQSGEYKTMMGTGIEEYLEMAISGGADIIGANCGNGMEGMIEIVKEIRTIQPDLPVLVHANAGLPIYKDGETIFPETAAGMASRVQALVNAGTNILGGCCGTTPEHIRLMTEIVKQIMRKSS